MNIKGSSVKATNNFVRHNFSEKYTLWLNSLPLASKKIYAQAPIITKWYPFIEGLKVPTEKIAELFYEGDVQKASFLIGKFSASDALKGVYKIFIKITNPRFVLKNLPVIFSTYYDFGITEVLELADNSGKYLIKNLPLEAKVLIPRIKGWTEEALHLVRRKPVLIESRILREDTYIDVLYNVVWE